MDYEKDQNNFQGEELKGIVELSYLLIVYNTIHID